MRKIFLVSLILFCTNLLAEDQQLIQSLIQKLPTNVRSSSSFVISKDNANEFKNLIASELFSLVRSGKIHMSVARELNYYWRRQDSWETSSLSPTGFSLDKEGNLEKYNFSFSGYPFGSNKVLSKQVDLTTAHKAIWNLEAGFWSFGNITYKGEIYWASENKFRKVADLNFERVYPKKINSSDTTDQLFRELVSVQYPYLKTPNTVLTFRFLSKEEDMVWRTSAATNEVSQLTDSNRTDDLFDTNISLTDVWTWGMKAGNVEVKSIEEQTVLVPYPQLNSARYRKGQDNCFEIIASDVGMSRQDTIERWNFQSNRYFGGSAWLPTHSVYVPRSVWKVEATARDPFSLYGRQIFYIDRESMLPVYKVIYNKTGDKVKTVILANGLAMQEDGDEHIPYTAYIIVIDEKDLSASVIDYSQMRYCMSLPVEYLDNFNPRKLQPEPPKPEATHDGN